MAENTSTRKPVEAGLNRYGQRLDEYNEFGQSLEAEVWHFDALDSGTVAPVPALETVSRPVREEKQAATGNIPSLAATHRRAA